MNAPGDKGTTTLTITPEFGFNQAVSVSCTGLPSEATCSANSVTPNGGPVMATVTFTTTAPSARLRPDSGGGLFYALLIPGLLGLSWLPVGSGLRRARMWGLISGVVLVLLWLPACGGGGSTTPATPSDPGTPAGSTTVSIVAAGAGGAPSHAVQITLTIK